MTSSERPRRCKLDTSNHRLFGGVDPARKSLKLDGVMDVLKAYDEYEGGINCSVCGKLYKSRVCFTKHLWEHSIYWDLFDDAKNQDRVLSIQAALILCGGWQNDKFSDLLVTTPQHHVKPANHERPPQQTTKLPSAKKAAQRKRKRYDSGGESVSSSSDNQSLTSSSDIENRCDFEPLSSGDESPSIPVWHISPQSDKSLQSNFDDTRVGVSVGVSPQGEEPSVVSSMMTDINCCPSVGLQELQGSVKRRRLAGLPPKKRWCAQSLAAMQHVHADSPYF